MATAKTNPVAKPIATVVMTALGTVFLGSVHSSAKCSEASSPTNMKQGVTKPDRNVTPVGHPVVLLKFSHT